MIRNNAIEVTKDQLTGAIIDVFNQVRHDHFTQSIKEINFEEVLKLNQQDVAFESALKYMGKSLDFISRPENILGSDKTKFGEIAEVFEVNSRNAFDVLHGRVAKATFEGVGRTAPEDYLIDGIKIQSKYINGLNNNLKHVIEHMDKYQNFAEEGIYHIPKDSHQMMMKVYKGESIEGLNSKTVKAIQDKIAQIEARTGKSFEEVVQSGKFKYREVQQNVAEQTIKKQTQDLTNQNDELKSDIKKDAMDKRQQATDNSQPSMGEALKAGAMGAIVSGTLTATMSIYVKCKQEEKNLFEFTPEDWLEVGVDFSKSAAKGGITGVAIYGLTNFTSLGAPLASGLVSSVWGISSLANDYINGNISTEEFYLQGQIICFESSIATLGAMVGQMVIPIPILGTLAGSIATQTLLQITKGKLGDREKELCRQAQQAYSKLMNEIEQKYQRILVDVLMKYEKLGGILNVAFDFDLNTSIRFKTSIELGLELGAPKNELLKSISEIDDYFLN